MSGKHPSQFLGLLVQEAVDVERQDLTCGKFWSGLGRRCLFSLQATCLFKDKKGFLRPAVTCKQVDDDQWAVVTRCLKLKLLHGFQMLPFDAVLCDTVVVTQPVPQQALTMRAFNAKATVLVVVEQVDMCEKCILVPAYLNAEFFDNNMILANAELQLFEDRVLAIDYLVFEMDPALVGCRFGEVVARLHSFPRPRSPAPALRSEDLGDGTSQLLAASQLMHGLNSSQQVRLQQLLAEGSATAAPAAPAIRIEEEQQHRHSSVLSAQEAKEDRAKVVKVKPDQSTLVREFADVTELQVTGCIQFNSRIYYIFTRQDGVERKLTEAGVTKA